MKCAILQPARLSYEFFTPAKFYFPRRMRYAGMAVEKLGLAVPADNSNNIELNLVVDSSRDRDDLKDWFDEVEGRKPDQRRQR